MADKKPKGKTKPKDKKNSTKTRQTTNKDAEALKAKRIANLIPGANKNGRPKGKLNFDTRVDLAIEALAIKMVEAHNSKKENKNKQITIEDIDIEGDIFMQLLNKARGGSEKMIDSFLDRRHGKATARIELTGANGNPIEIKERKEEAKKKARNMLNLWTKK